MSFDAGALLFKIQTAGAQQAERDLKGVSRAADDAGKKSQSSAKGVTELGKSTDQAGKAAKGAKTSLDGQAAASDKAGNSAKAAAQKEREAAQASKERADAADRVGKVLLGVGVAAGAMVGVSVAKFAEFDQGMSNVQAATHESSENMELLRDAALDAGAKTVFSATEAASGIEELSKAGVKTKDVIGGGLAGALDLAAAGEISVGDAAETAASTMTQFGLAGKDVSHIADLLAAGAGKAQGGVGDLSQALNQSGLVASQMGLSVEETVGSLAEFASAGLVGSDAGTSFRAMLLRLANPTQQSAKQMDDLGLSFYDAQGDFIGMEGVAEQLQSRLSGLSQEQRNAALASIFGQDAIRSASILYEGGADKVQEWTDAVDDSGYAQETAAKRLDNLKGDWEGFTGALDTALITMGEAADGPIRGLVQGLTGLVNGFNALPDGVQQSVLVLGGVAAAVGIVGGAALIAIPKVAEFRTAVTTLGITSSSVKGKLGGVASFITGPWGVAIGVGIAALSAFASAHAEAQALIDQYSEALKQEGPAAQEAVDKITTSALQLDKLSGSNFFKYGFFNKSALDAAEEMGLNLQDVQDAASGNEDALARVTAQMKELTGLENPWEAATVGIRPLITNQAIVYDALKKTNSALDDAAHKNEQAANATGSNADASGVSAEVAEEAADAYLTESDAVGELNDQLSSLIDQITEANGQNSDAITSTADYEESLDALDEQVKNISEGVDGYKKTLNLATEAGRENVQLLQDQASSSQDAAAAMYQLDGDTDAYVKRLKDGRATFIENAQRLGATREEAIKLADKVYAIPDEREIDVLAHTAEASKKVSGVHYKVEHLPDGSINVTADTSDAISEVDKAAANIRARAITVAVNAVVNLSTLGKFSGSSGGFADGGVVSYHANGSVPEHHVAQIARAGEWRVWAEDETGGEAYIPLAASKRPRSEAIMAETASRLGGVYIPAAATRYADGNVARPAAPRAGRSASGPIIGSLVLQGTGKPSRDVDVVKYKLRQLAMGSRVTIGDIDG